MGGDVPAPASSLHMLVDVEKIVVWLKAFATHAPEKLLRFSDRRLCLSENAAFFAVGQHSLRMLF
jgi:hypothetical protein